MAKFAALSLLAGVEAGGVLAVTWEDCGAQHGKVTDLQPTTVPVGSTTTITGAGVVDEDVASATFTATVSASGVQLTKCSGDATSDITCKLPLGAGKIVVKAVEFPIKAGKQNIAVDVSTSSIIPASLAAVDAHIEASDAAGESLICMDVHTKKQEQLEVTGGVLAVTWEDCGAQHGKVTDLQPTTVPVGSTTTITGAGVVDEDVASATFTATVSASGVQLTKCSGDATSDITCKLPLGAGKIVVKAVEFPIKAGKQNIAVDVSTSSIIPASLAAVDAHIEASDAAGESLICMDVHTKKQEQLEVTGGVLAVTWEDCGAQHGKVTDLQPNTVPVGSTTTITGAGVVDEDVASATFTATVSASGVQLTKCSGDATSDITCKLPLGAGKIVVKAVEFPIKAGKQNIAVDVSTSSIIPASLAAVDAHIEASDAAGESLICMDVHTKKQSFAAILV